MSAVSRLVARWVLVLVLCGAGLASSPATATAPEAEWLWEEAVAVIAIAQPAPTPVIDVPEEPVIPQLPPQELIPQPIEQIEPDDRLGRIPVLMYHEIGDVANNNYVRLHEFESQMEWLAANGYHSVTLAQVYRHINDFEPLPPKPIVISFDDGYLTFYTLAVPILERHSFVAVNFIITDMVGRTEHMDWDQIRSVAAAGMEIGSHTLSHVDLRNVSNQRLERELVQSKQQLESQIGLPVHFFCYPSGRYAPHTPDAVKQAGYLGALTTNGGPVTPAQSPFLWHRVRILRGETVASFGTKLKQATGEVH